MRTQRPCKANPYAALRDQVFSASNTRARWTVGHHRSITAGPHLRGAEGVESMSKSSLQKYRHDYDCLDATGAGTAACSGVRQMDPPTGVVV